MTTKADEMPDVIWAKPHEAGTGSYYAYLVPTGFITKPEDAVKYTRQQEQADGGDVSGLDDVLHKMWMAWLDGGKYEARLKRLYDIAQPAPVAAPETDAGKALDHTLNEARKNPQKMSGKTFKSLYDAAAAWRDYLNNASYDPHYNDLMRVEPEITAALKKNVGDDLNKALAALRDELESHERSHGYTEPDTNAFIFTGGVLEGGISEGIEKCITRLQLMGAE